MFEPDINFRYLQNLYLHKLIIRHAYHLLSLRLWTPVVHVPGVCVCVCVFVYVCMCKCALCVCERAYVFLCACEYVCVIRACVRIFVF